MTFKEYQEKAATTASYTFSKTYQTLKDTNYGAGKSMRILYLSKMQ